MKTDVLYIFKVIRCIQDKIDKIYRTFLDDLVFITSDGVSDNFDPVVGKFCVIKNAGPSPANKENSTVPSPSRNEKPTS